MALGEGPVLALGKLAWRNCSVSPYGALSWPGGGCVPTQNRQLPIAIIKSASSMIKVETVSTVSVHTARELWWSHLVTTSFVRWQSWTVGTRVRGSFEWPVRILRDNDSENIEVSCCLDHFGSSARALKKLAWRKIAWFEKCGKNPWQPNSVTPSVLTICRFSHWKGVLLLGRQVIGKTAVAGTARRPV
ncbi:uncharacterized protein LAESUDRAFT_350798 [Laetiporus sulphureus 93-53]|uniref:Uncharacterized protein n=1 Tax=Laetiporus sulphureus 93-53 TaxID=1314785 RepID=A0A165GTV0_9APHY|nr:uncharacterized protein LAESUDRAFT_350798 [Laetiporus sulphureus 93-53]KZT10804.1 hypothetical protein LAESUDRAFT_350798 [Laetiporus sulphureus 93-53]